MAKNKMYSTAGEKKNPMLLKQIPEEQLRKFEKAAKRNRRLAMETRTGQGAHDPDKRTRRRSARRDGKLQSRNYERN